MKLQLPVALADLASCRYYDGKKRYVLSMETANPTSAESELETPMVDGIANRWIKDRIYILEACKLQDPEEYAFLKRELASENHLVTENEKKELDGYYGAHIVLAILSIVWAGGPLFVTAFLLGVFLIS